jgi:hypothetical protein
VSGDLVDRLVAACHDAEAAAVALNDPPLIELSVIAGLAIQLYADRVIELEQDRLADEMEAEWYDGAEAVA